jgi:hypothetical protein
MKYLGHIWAVLALLCVMVGFLVLTGAPALAAKGYVLSGTFGSQGSGDGEFMEPGGLAVNDSTDPLMQPAAGDVYVVDTGDERIERFSSEGAYISQFDGTATPANSFSFNVDTTIAVDNSGNALDPSLGDVYVEDSGNDVIDKFDATGEKYEGQLTGTCEKPGESAVAPGPCAGSSLVPFGELESVAVDPFGNLWVYDNRGGEGHIDEFGSTGNFVKTFAIGQTHEQGEKAAGLAVNSTSVYVIDIEQEVLEFDSATGEKIGDLEVVKRPRGLAIDSSSNNLLINEDGDKISVFEPAIENDSPLAPLQTFPQKDWAGSESAIGIAVNVAGVVYVTHPGAGNVDVYRIPPVNTERPASVQETSATLNGSVNPEGEALTECYFEYGVEESYGRSVPCAHTPEGTRFVNVSAQIAGLQPGTTYHFRLSVNSSKGIVSGGDETLFTPDRPLIEGEQFAGTGSTTATASAQVNPRGRPTTYYIEYGTNIGYGSSTPPASVGAGALAAGVQVHLSGLQPGTLYHARVVATNQLGTAFGGDLTFTTSAALGASTSTLPDGRAYELVSTANKADVYVPQTTDKERTTELESILPVRASADGDSIAYLAEPPGEGGSGAQGAGLGDEYLATRAPQSWSATDLYPPRTPLSFRYVAFSSDLSTGVVDGLRPAGAAPCDEFSLRRGQESLQPFFTEQASSSCGPTGEGIENSFAGASADYSHVLYESAAALTTGAVESAGPHDYNLYESVSGRLRLVNVLPGPNPQPDPDATFGGPHGAVGGFNDAAGFTNVISSDGSRIFWTDLNTDDLYLREDGTTTIPVSAGAAEYWTATPDGRYVFYTEGEGSAKRLWRFDVDRFQDSAQPEAQALAEAREELTGEGSSVLGVIGVNEIGEDGSYIYFVADGALAAGASEQQCRRETEGERNGEEPKQGNLGCNLYLDHDGETRLVAMLSPEDNNIAGPRSIVRYGDWQHNVGNRTSELTPDGHSVGFLSRSSLTGYDNVGCSQEYESVGCNEVFIYDSDTRQLSCASCSPTGAPIVAPAKLPVSEVSRAAGGAYMQRWLSDDGSRVFFDTKQPLAPQDTNGRLNVYEWERDGAGSCLQSAGCVYLLSGGSSSGDSYLLDASANGDDVFFTSREDFVPQARGEAIKIYDARVGGGFPESSTACTGTGCQGVPPAPPIFATPSSVTFNGAGNFPGGRGPSPAKKVTVKKTVKCKKASRGSRKGEKGKCVKKPKKKKNVKKATNDRRGK